MEGSAARLIIQTGLDQLNLYMPQNDSEHLRKDIEGYKLVLQQKDDVIRDFLETKFNARQAGERFENNLAVIENLKSRGVWNGEA